MKSRFYIFIIIIFVLILLVAAAIASQPTVPTDGQTNTYGQVTVTINKAIGIDQITIANLNTGTSIKKTLIDLPYSFNCTKGDYLRFTETVQSGYIWNAWQFSSGSRAGTFDQHNPVILSADDNIVMTPKCVFIDVSNSTGVLNESP